uniref:Uncharacterized protein n=1 Tax=Marmota marmota marmota TaxID=9994 RepID=A0A8C5ZX12_MARMA
MLLRISWPCHCHHVLLVSFNCFIFPLNLPVATWNIDWFLMVPSGNMGVTKLRSRKPHMKEPMTNLCFHLLHFLMYFYNMILSVIND